MSAPKTPRRVYAADIGASGGKCFVGTFEDGGFSMDEIHRFAHEASTFYVSDESGMLTDRTAWDQTLIYENILTGLRNYRREVSDTLDTIAIDTWGADYQLMTPDGDRLGGYFAYRDHRLDGVTDEIDEFISSQRLFEITGISKQPYNLSTQLRWLMSRRPDLLVDGCFLLPTPSLFNFYLCGSREVDSTWASVSQLMDARSGEWSQEVLDALRIPRSILPEIVAPGTTLGQLHEPLASELRLNRATVLASAAHDTASAFAAAPVENPEEAMIISSGTWSIMGQLIPAPITSDEAGAFGLANEGGIGNIRFLRNCMGTWLVQELRRIWRNEDGQESSWDELNKTTEAATPFGSLVDPDDESFYNPENMQTAIDAFCSRTGQPTPSDRGAYLRLVYESLALKYRYVIDRISEISGHPARVIHIVGGGSRNEMLNEFTANATHRKVITGPEEATAVGNVVIQALGLGIIASMDAAQSILRQTFPIKEYTPQNTAPWSEAYDRFRSLNPSLKD